MMFKSNPDRANEMIKKNFDGFLNRYFFANNKKAQMAASVVTAGILFFLVVAFTFPFKNNIFSTVYQKPLSQAASPIFNNAPVGAVALCTNLQSGKTVISGVSTTVSVNEAVAVFANFSNTQAKIVWKATGGKVADTKMNSTTWIAPKLPGAYQVSVNVNGVDQVSCIASFNVQIR